MKQAVRLMRITVSIATPVLLGYAIGTFLILVFLEWLDGLQAGNAMPHLYFRYQFSGFDDYFYTVHPSFAVTIMSFVVYTSLICSMLMLWPAQIAYPGRLVGSRMTRRRVNLIWHAALWRHQPTFGFVQYSARARGGGGCIRPESDDRPVDYYGPYRDVYCRGGVREH